MPKLSGLKDMNVLLKIENNEVKTYRIENGNFIGAQNSEEFVKALDIFNDKVDILPDYKVTA